MLEILYHAWITLDSGQIVKLHAPLLYTVLDAVNYYVEYGISSIVVQKSRKVD